MSEIKTVLAEEEITYKCECPHCKETVYSEYHEKWDIAENYESTVQIECSECYQPFNVNLP